MTREDVIDGYMINEKHVIAEMLYDTINKYEKRIAELEAPKPCDGCKHDTDEGCRLYPVGLVCVRFDMVDRYEQKDK